MKYEYLTVIFALVIKICLGRYDGKDHQTDAVDVFFRTNLDEMNDVAIQFDKPLPAWLKGTLIRNGIGRFEFGKRAYANALDANAKLSSWKFTGNGSAFFSTKMVYSKSYNESLVANDVAPYMLLDSVKPSFDIFQELEMFKNGPDNMNVNVFNFGVDKSIFSIVSDYWNSYTINPNTLETLQMINPPIPNVNPMDSMVTLSSAHPLPEYNTSNYITFVSLAPPVPQLKSRIIVMRIKSSNEREEIATIEVDKASYMHSFALTENYAIIFAVPFYVDPIGVLKHMKPLDAFQWVSSDVTKLYIVNIKTGQLRTLKTENMFFMHIVNAYESKIFNDEILVDVCTYTNADSLHSFDLANLHNPATRKKVVSAMLKRYTLDLTNNVVNVHTYDNYDKPSNNAVNVNRLDFPTINENFRSQKYCYTYGIVYNYDDEDFLHMALAKKDVCNGTNDAFWVSRGKYLNEAFFVPRPGGTSEDDGILIFPILDTDAQTTNITIFNAKDLSVLTTATLPTNIPFGTHGRFFDYIF